MSNTLVEGFLSTVFVWVFFSLSLMTAIVILRGIDHLAARVVNAFRVSDKDRQAVRRVEEWLTLVDRECSRR